MVDGDPDKYMIVKTALSLKDVNNFLCTPNIRTEVEIHASKTFLFAFGVSLATLFETAVTTKMHRMIRHVHFHVILLGSFRRVSFQENEMEHEEFKFILNTTNKHLDYL